MAEKPKKVRPKTKSKENLQSERFIESARNIGADESGETFEKAFKRIVPSKSGKS